MTDKRDEEIEKVLNADQREKLQKARADAAAKKKKTTEKKVEEAKGN